MARLGRRQTFKPKLPALLVGGSPGVYTLTADTGTYTLSGNAAGTIANRTLSSNTGTYTLTGNSANILAVRKITADLGAYTLTGNSANLLATRRLQSDLGTYTSTGNTAILSRFIVFSASAGTYSLTGRSAGLAVSRYFVVAVGTYTLSGNDAVISQRKNFVADVGNYTLTGNNSNLIYNRKIISNTGSYTLSGNDAIINLIKKLLASAGNYTLTGNTANLLYNRNIVSNTGSYTLIGNALNLLDYRVFTAAKGTYSLTGNNATLQRALAFIAASGNYTLSGNSVSLIANRKLISNTGIYSYTGFNAGLLRNLYLLIATGNYTTTGNTASLFFNRRLNSVTGNYVLNSGVDLYKILTFTAGYGAYTLSGNSAGISRIRAVFAETGIYILTGIDAGVYKSVVNIHPDIIGSITSIIPPSIIFDTTYGARSYGCYDLCTQVFDRLVVWPKITTGNTRVEWKLKPSFLDAGPYIFQLQVGRTGLTGADDWVDVGSPVTDLYYKEDTTKRVYGKFQWTHYRVKLYTESGIYYSDPEPALGVLNFHDWNIVKDMLRMEKLRLTKGRAGREGALLKRKIFGTPCSCIDRQTKETTKPNHVECYGTGIVGGYYSPLRCVYVETSPIGTFNNLDNSGSLGTIDNATVTIGRMINIPQIMSGDIWISKSNNTRWLIHSIRNIAEFKGVPVAISAEMRLLPLNHVAYKIPCDFIYNSLIC